MEQVAQSGGGVSILGVIESVRGLRSEQPTLPGPALDYMISRGAIQPQPACDCVGTIRLLM